MKRKMDPWQGQWKHIKAYYYVAIGNRYFPFTSFNWHFTSVGGFQWHQKLLIPMQWFGSLSSWPHFKAKGLERKPNAFFIDLVVHIGTSSIYSYGNNQYTNMYFLYVECRIIPPIKAIISLTMTCNKFRRIHWYSSYD